MSSYDEQDMLKVILPRIAQAIKGLKHQTSVYDQVAYGLLSGEPIPRDTIVEYGLNKLLEQVALVDQLNVDNRTKYRLGVRCLRNFHTTITSCFARDPEVITDFLRGTLYDPKRITDKTTKKLVM